MDAAMASEATIMNVPGNMHIDASVIGVACIKSEVKFDLKGHRDCLEVTEAITMTVLDIQQQMTR